MPPGCGRHGGLSLHAGGARLSACLARAAGTSCSPAAAAVAAAAAGSKQRDVRPWWTLTRWPQTYYTLPPLPPSSLPHTHTQATTALAPPYYLYLSPLHTPTCLTLTLLSPLTLTLLPGARRRPQPRASAPAMMAAGQPPPHTRHPQASPMGLGHAHAHAHTHSHARAIQGVGPCIIARPGWG
jgi:hypothetical protein